ncbi:hypothetical protein ACFWP5_06465 [Streptomyces sp. NPDC058469]|uniref:hypothetical protein n=1 Tax=Streptomyces sp. NPDC058469 TaxID=3346514 RepID=UPI00366974FA
MRRPSAGAGPNSVEAATSSSPDPRTHHIGELIGLTAKAAPHQLNVAQAATLIDTARPHVRRAADEIDEVAREGRRPDLETRARLRMDGSRAMRCARDGVSLLLDTAGASSYSDDSPLQLAWRDIGTASPATRR